MAVRLRIHVRWLLAAGLAVSSAAFALGSADSGVVPTDVSTPGSNDQFADTEPGDRAAASLDRFGDYQSEDYKQNLLRTIQAQSALYGNLLPGGAAPFGTPAWRSIGPANAKYETNGITLKVADSGRVRTILQSPSNPDTVYVLTAGGGLWMTTTFSQTNPRWQALTDALSTTSGGGVAFGRTPNVLYLGLGDPYDAFPTLGGVVVKSTDGGMTWAAYANLPGAFKVMDVKVDTSGPTDVVLVATNAGIFRSADAGASFVQVFTLTPGGGAWSLVRSSAGWLASTTTGPCGGATCYGAIVVSIDGGAHWVPIPNAGNGLSGAGRITLANALPGDPVVYALAANPDGFAQRDLFKSVDGGLDWIALGVNASRAPTNPNGFQPDLNLLGEQGSYNQMVLVDPADASRNTVYLGGQLSIAKTADGGNSWTLISDWLPGIYSNLPYVHADHHAAASLLVNGQRGVLFGTDGGIFLSTDGGATFSFDKNNGLVSLLSQTVASSAMNPQNLVIGLQDAGSRARLGASTYFNQVTGGDGEGVAWSQANNARTLTSVPGAIYSSPGLLPNTFGNWVQVRLNPSVALFYTPLTALSSVADPSGLVFLSATANGAIYTLDGGLHWFYLARAGGRLPSNFQVRNNWHVVGIDPTASSNDLAIGGTAGRVAISLDGGFSWTVRFLNSLVPGFASSVDAPTWTANGVLYVTSESPTPGAIRVVRSGDGGSTFLRADAGLPDAAVYQVVADPRDASGNTVYAATYLGVYRSTNGGASWNRFGAGLPAVRTTGLFIAEDGSVLRAATYGRGVWEINP